MNREIRTAFFTALILGITVVMLYFLYLTRGVFPPIIYGVIIAYVLLPLTNLLSRKLPRMLASMISILLFILVFAVIGYLLIPVIIHEFNELVIRLPNFYVNLTNALNYVTKLFNPAGVKNYFSQVMQRFIDTLQAQAGTILEKMFSFAVNKFSVFPATVLSLLLSFFFMKDSPILYRITLKRIHPKIRKSWRSFFEKTNSEIRAYFSTLVFIAIFTGLLMGSLSSLAGIKYAVLIGVLDASLEMLPYIGPTTVFIVGSVLSLTTSVGSFFAFALIFSAIELAQNSLVTPHLVGGKLKITPVIIILMIAVGGALFGALGVIIATPTFLIGRNIVALRSKENSE